MRYEVEVKYEARYMVTVDAEDPNEALQKAQAQGLQTPTWSRMTHEVSKGVDGRSES